MVIIDIIVIIVIIVNIFFIEVILIILIMEVIVIIRIIELIDLFRLVGSRIVYELDHKNPILYVIPIQSILGKLPFVPVGDTGTIPQWCGSCRLRHHFPGAPGDRRPGSGDGCRMWFVNSWALGWSRDI